MDDAISGSTAGARRSPKPAPLSPTREPSSRKLPQISVVVSAGRDVEALQLCLEALLAQDFVRDGYEIVVVEARNPVRDKEIGKFARDRVDTPSVRRIVVEAARQSHGAPTIQHLPAERYLRARGLPDSFADSGLAAARNRGWHCARGAVIAFLDASLVPGPGWLAHGLAALTADVAAVKGTVKVPLTPPANEDERQAATLAARGRHGSNCFVRRAALAEVGGYDERFPADWRDDADLQFSLVERFDGQLPIRRSPLAEVTRMPAGRGWGSCLQAQRNLQFDALLAAKHPELYRQCLRSLTEDLVHWGQLMIVSLLALVATAVMAAQFALAAAALALWSALTAGFCASRLRGTRPSVRHVTEMVLTSMVLPPLAVFWRCVGTLRFRRPSARVQSLGRWR